MYSCSASFISFGIVFTVCEHEYMNISPPPNYRSSAAPGNHRYASSNLNFDRCSNIDKAACALQS